MKVLEAKTALKKMDRIAKATGLGRVPSGQQSRGYTKSKIGRQDTWFLQHQWTCVISRTLNCRTSFIGTEDEWYSEVMSWRTIRGTTPFFTEQGASASHMTAAKVLDVISKLPGSSGQASGAWARTCKSKSKTLRAWGIMHSANTRLFFQTGPITHCVFLPSATNPSQPVTAMRCGIGKLPNYQNLLRAWGKMHSANTRLFFKTGHFTHCAFLPAAARSKKKWAPGPIFGF